jgi:hypothetical protein
VNIGTKSVLFGAHQFLIHPICVARAWTRLYGFPLDPRLWVAFFVHDLGYCGKPNMDGPEGEEHPKLGAKIMGWLFDKSYPTFWPLVERDRRWHDFTLYHSRYLSKKHGVHYSKLCVADKLATAITPWWLYLPAVTATGEINEYMRGVITGYESGSKNIEQWWYQAAVAGDKRLWFKGLCEYMSKWAYEHADMREDGWTKNRSEVTV